MKTKMTAMEIMERLNKAQEAVDKTQELLTKRQNVQLPKLLRKEKQETDGRLKRLIQCDIEHLKEDIENTQYKIEEKKKVLKKWQDKLEAVNAESKKLDEIPQQLKQLQKQIADEIAEWRIYYREQMKKDRKEMKHEDFRKKYSYRETELIYKKDEEIRRQAETEAKYWILDLIARVQKKVGQITKWQLHIDYRALNGWVIGTQGKAKIETIVAGGYNIQCLHTRVLVK